MNSSPFLMKYNFYLFQNVHLYQCVYFVAKASYTTASTIDASYPCLRQAGKKFVKNTGTPKGFCE